MLMTTRPISIDAITRRDGSSLPSTFSWESAWCGPRELCEQPQLSTGSNAVHMRTYFASMTSPGVACRSVIQEDTREMDKGEDGSSRIESTPTAFAFGPIPTIVFNRWLRPIGPLLTAGSVWLLSPTVSYFDGWKPAESLFSDVSFSMASFRVSVISQY